MELAKVTVEIDYRFDAGKCRSCENGWHGSGMCARCKGTGAEPPSQRCLIARVRVPSIGNGFTFGPCLFGPKIVHRIDRAKQLSTYALSGKCNAINFIISDRIPKGTL